MKTRKEMNGIEKIAYTNIKRCFDYEVGGMYNCYQDHCIEYIPDTLQEAKEIIYDNCITNYYYAPGCVRYDRAPREMRFAGSEFIKECIDYLFDKDEEGDVAELAEIKNW